MKPSLIARFLAYFPIWSISLGLVSAFLSACSPASEAPTPAVSNAKLIFRLRFDSTQTRLNNLAQSAGLAAGNAAQSPRMQGMSIHYVELAPPTPVALGQGTVLYQAPETKLGGDQAIDFDSAKVTADGETFFSIPLSKVKPGTYKHLRVSLAYQAGEITLRHAGVNYPATIASFIGFNTYIRSFRPRSQAIAVNGNRTQGFWAAEVAGLLFQGQAPPGSTTVPNPLFASSPIPQGSCVVTGAFPNDLVVGGQEGQDIIVTVSFSTNRSFEWRDANGNGAFEPALGETLVDMGVRGMVVARQ
jgi:hypothetical protein